MKSFFINFIKEFKLFVLGLGKNILFTSFFYSLLLITCYITSVSFELRHFEGRNVSVATINALDIGIRVALFYKCIQLLFFSFIIFNLIGFLFSKTKSELLRSSEIKIINYSSLAGILFLIFYVFHFDFKIQAVRESLAVIYFLHLVMFSALLIKGVLQKTGLKAISVSLYSIIITVSIGLYFVFLNSAVLFGAVKPPDFFTVTFAIALLLIIAYSFWTKQSERITSGKRSLMLAWAMVPLASMPLIEVLKDEIFLVLKGKGFQLQGTFFIYVALLIILSLIILIRYKKIKKDSFRQSNTSLSKLVALNYFPLLVFSIISYLLYRHFIISDIGEFEPGNKYLPIMEFKKWGIVPILEKFNSHLFSDFFYTAIYVFINGMKDYEIELYDFFNYAVIGLLYYYLIYFISRNAYVALFTILFFPFNAAMLPEEQAYALFGIFILFKLIELKASLKLYLLFFTSLLLLVLWKMDIGFACLMVIPVMFIFYSIFSNKARINFKLLIKAGVIVFGAFASLVLIISLIRHINIIEKAKNALNYLSSVQTYGYTGLSPDDSFKYRLHYFIFPAIVLIIIIALLYNFKRLNRSKKQRFAYISLMMISLYYLANFQRGLIRHSLLENTDAFGSSFVYVIISGSVFVFWTNKNHILKFVTFIAASFFIIINYKSPDVAGAKSVYEQMAAKFVRPFEDITKNDSRSIYKEKKYSDTRKFLTDNLSGDETFIDFGNNPMMYYYTEKVSPSYFYQNPICSHNEYLQKQFISDLKDYNAPYMIFGRTHFELNTIDSVQNCMRHYRIAEHLYANYKPYIVVDNFCIWKKKDFKAKAWDTLLYNYGPTSDDSGSFRNVIITKLQLKPKVKYLVKLNSKFHLEFDLWLKHDGMVYPATIDYTYKNTSTGYFIIESKRGSHCFLELRNKNYINEFSIRECTYLPDFYSERCRSYNFDKLPYIWGTFDKEAGKEYVLFDSDPKLVLNNRETKDFYFHGNIDKSTGNTIVFTIKNNSLKTQKVKFFFTEFDNPAESFVNFDILPSQKAEKYAVRISSIYNWQKNNMNHLKLSLTSDTTAEISNIQITKGK